MFFNRKKLSGYIFQIGFNRCGTSSIAYFFEKNGYSAAHWEKGTIAVGMELARLKNKPLLTYCKEYDIYTDLEKVNMWRLPKLKWKYPIFRKFLRETEVNVEEAPPVYAYKHFKQLDKHYPESKFIFNTREKEDWIKSRLKLNKDNNLITYRSCRCGDNYHSSEQELIQCWGTEWDEHHQNVLDYFEDKEDKLLYFDIQKDGVDKLTNFFSDLDLDTKHWKKRNKSKTK
ncbi:hypothetical protein A8B79_07430 [Balneola sp. EhC07]|uniref:sulfotransferase n=1 Tax=Balneola sp. EhC07 TaxID=1849360 RepID=UPI0007F50420|nr:sulfotransferase [Balneola sp. EhC07]OAN61285.1 hypothetical protein A8B79_07430 [Balneola sp. EhC07]